MQCNGDLTNASAVSSLMKVCNVLSFFNDLIKIDNSLPRQARDKHKKKFFFQPLKVKRCFPQHFALYSVPENGLNDAPARKGRREVRKRRLFCGILR
jgi:hypothetical protein